MPLSLTPQQARRLCLQAQRLHGPAPAARPDAAALLDAVRALGCLQLDPISVVARSHQLVLFSRVGPYDLAELDRLLWRERALFEYWAHCASIVLTEDYPIHAVRMRAYLAPSAPKQTAWGRRMRAWVQVNDRLRRGLLGALRRRGPLLSRDLEEDGPEPKAWVSTGWTSGRNVSQMLDYLWMSGQIMVAGRVNGQKLWDLAKRVLPEWTPRTRLTEREATRRAIEKSLQALGVATPRQIQYHFVRGCYPHFREALADLEQAGALQRAEIRDWPGEWFVHADALARLAEPSDQGGIRTTLLSPFDNLIADRARARQFFGFDYKIEIYTPKARRRYGYYVMPILHGERLIGRLDPEMDRAAGRLTVHAVHAEPGAPRDAGPAVAGAVQSLAVFLGAREVHYNRANVPAVWKQVLQ